MPTRPPRHNAHIAIEARLETQRNNNKSKIYDHAWRKFRNEFLNENPLCAHCFDQGKIVAANEVDHIVPLTGKDDPTRLSAASVQSLCTRCHSSKTARETHVKRGL